MNPKRILISGGGIAGLTLAIELKRHGFEPVVIEREPGARTEGYMMDFFGTGWDVAERMGLTGRLRAIRYPIDTLEFVDTNGEAYVRTPIDRVARALDNNYVYLLRQDLERILAERANEVGVELRYGMSLAALDDRSDSVHVRFEDGGEDDFALVIGADGVHSRVRELAFGPERDFARFLGLYVAAFHAPRGDLPVAREVKLYQDIDRMTFLYPLSAQRVDATFAFRHDEVNVAHGERLAFLQAFYRGSGWIAEDILRAYSGEAPIYFDSATQIVMPNWHKGRVALIGDACGCLTLLAGQGSHMAMAGGYVLASQLARQRDHAAAFAAYQKLLRPPVTKKQKSAARFAGLFVPTKNSRPWLRRLVIRAMFSKALIGIGLRSFGTRSVLPQHV
jgi:2-polyprenyl-6-methoxyphenol hydroxylase-like FAD-dependent oxidoreductase